MLIRGVSLNRRHIFLFDTAVIVCKRRGDNYEMKEAIDLHLFKITNNPTSDKENRKVCARSPALCHKRSPCFSAAARQRVFLTLQMSRQPEWRPEEIGDNTQLFISNSCSFITLIPPHCKNTPPVLVQHFGRDVLRDSKGDTAAPFQSFRSDCFFRTFHTGGE